MDDNYAQAAYHVGRAKALWAQVPEQIHGTLSVHENYVHTLRAQSIDWHFKAADVFSRLAEIDESKRELVAVREDGCVHSMVDPDCFSCLRGHWERLTGAIKAARL